MLTTNEYNIAKEQLSLLFNSRPSLPGRASAISLLQDVIKEYDDFQTATGGAIIESLSEEQVNEIKRLAVENKGTAPVRSNGEDSGNERETIEI